MQFWLTTFPTVFAHTMTGELVTLDDLADRIKATRAAAKADLPLIKTARFAQLRTPKTAKGGGDSLRHDGNVTSISGVIGDYDGEAMSVADARSRLECACFAYLIYTTPSHDSARPRWRVVAPFSREHVAGDYPQMMNRLNGVLGGCLARESWALSQSFYPC
jgi:hypothetical protein